jgi:pentatricopeptide repeat protein
MMCALSQNDFEKAKQVFHQMDESSQKEPMTRFITFKVALGCEDEELATESLAALVAASDDEHHKHFLYATIIAAQEAGNRKLGATAMKALVEKHDFNNTDVHYPALLRSTIRMMYLGLSRKDGDQQDLSHGDAPFEDDICSVFESGTRSRIPNR